MGTDILSVLELKVVVCKVLESLPELILCVELLQLVRYGLLLHSLTVLHFNNQPSVGL